jgi:hypothetical protein
MNSPTDQLINQVLDALRKSEPPAGLEQRIAARLAQTAEARSLNSSTSGVADGGISASFFSVILNAVKDPRISFAEVPLYTSAGIASILILALISSTFLFHRRDQTAAQWNPTAYQPTQISTPSQAAPSIDTNVARNDTPALHRPPAISAGPAASTPDLDAIALAETQAPSRPAPPMPMTAQEVLLLSATRIGQPIELAELDTLRDTNLRSLSQARERASIRQYIQGLLGPLAAAERFNPTSPSPSPDAVQPVTESDPPSSK